MKKKIAIIGAGLQAQRRGPVITKDSEYEVGAIVDLILDKAVRLSKVIGGLPSRDWKKIIKDRSIKAVLVLTYPDSHAEISIAAMEYGKDVLCEKPLAFTIEQAKKMTVVANRTKKILKCGFNHRHHPAIEEAYRQFRAGAIGKPIFGRSKYGIGGRQGLEKEWRSNPKFAPGGQLIDQGIHIIDLYRWFLGDIIAAAGMTATNLWPIKPIEDNGFGIIRNETGVIASLHSSLTQWINLFEFEIYGEKGSLTVQNLGGSYGMEKLIIAKHHPSAPFSHQTIEYRGNDNSWQNEWNEFTNAIKTRCQPLGNGVDGLKAMEIVTAIYRSSQTGKTIKIS